MSETVLETTEVTTEEIIADSNGGGGVVDINPEESINSPRFRVNIYFIDDTVLTLPASLYTFAGEEGFVNKITGNKYYHDKMAIRFSEDFMPLSQILPWTHKAGVSKVEVYATDVANLYTEENEKLDTTTPLYVDEENYWNGVGRFAAVSGAHFEITEYEINLVHFI